jgi:NAD(P)-dependent dehydrogenase (short-subunit alcohol dehydrogenase family)
MKKNYLVIGGTSGIGKAIADRLADNGHMVIITGRSDSNGAPHDFHPLDVTDDEPGFPDTESIDGLVYCPGTINLKPLRSLKISDFMNDIQVNLLGGVKTIKQYLPALNEGASVLFFSTVAVKTGMPFHASVASAKGAVEGLTRSLAAELAPKVRVNAVAPSLTDTPLASGLLNNENKMKNASERHPLKRIGQAEDIASLACFLLSDDARFITGQVIGADGGMGSLKI